MPSRRNAVSMGALLVSQIYVAGLAVAQETVPGTAPSPNPVAQEVQTESTSADGTPRRRAKGEEIVVTGSRIRRKDLTTPAPITVITKDAIQASGKVSIGDFLQTLPEQGNAINTSFNNGGNGTTRVSLRGLGAERTLVLLNGRRFVPGGNGANASVDLNSIPTAAIERIEVLKDGASAIYGSDAIGGVVNLITRKRFDGSEVSGLVGTSTHLDGTIYDFNGTTGVTADRGGAIFSIGYYTQKPVFAGDRDFSKFPYAYDATGNNGSSNNLPGLYRPGSGTVPAGRLFSPTCSSTRLEGCVATLPGGVQVFRPATIGDPAKIARFNALYARPGPPPGSFVRDPSVPGLWRPFTSTNLPEDGGDGYNFQPENYLVTPAQRVSLYSSGEYKFGAIARSYYEASFVNRISDQKLAPEPLSISAVRVTISKDNIYNPFGVDLPVFSRRLSEFGKRSFVQDLDTFRVVAGVDGILPESAGFLSGWFWDVSLNYGRTVGTENKTGNLFVPNLAAAVGPSFRDASGTPRCGTAGNVIAGCVPLDLFGGGNPGTITPDQITALTFNGTLRALNQITAVQFNTSGELFRLLADRPVGLALGYEYRFLLGENIPDPVTGLGLATGNIGTQTRGSYYINEGYGELSIPIVSNVPGAVSLEATAAARVFKYSNFGTDITYKFGGLWRIIQDVSLRGTYSTAFRAPSISDLYLGERDSFPPNRDPCRGPTAGGGTPPASCGAISSGDTSTQLRTRVGGNPVLKPETAKIFTAGIVLQPTFVKGLTATVDYYNITIDSNISTIGAAQILAGCYPQSGTPNQAYCDLIQRDPTNRNQILNIFNLNQNVGQDKTDGIDISVRYFLPTDFGRFGFSWDATWLRQYNRLLAGGVLNTARGYFSQDLGIFPAWRFISGATYALGGFTGGVTVHFIGGLHECGDGTGDFSGSGLCYRTPQYVRAVLPYSTWDVYLAYALQTSIGKTTLGAGMNNVFDRSPSKIYNGFLAASDPSAYDYLGRFGYVRLSQAF